MPKQLSTQLSTHTVHLGSGNDQFEVTVNNLSDRFATFALDLSASGLDRQASPDWYRLTPDLSAKIPAGDRVNFVVNILEVPPIPGGFSGKMNLNVNVTCIELGEEDRQLVNLVVGGSGTLPAVIKLPQERFEALPGDVVEIPLQIHNPNRNTANLRATIKGLPNPWLNGHEKRLQVAPKGTVNVLFVCQPPFDSEAGAYPLALEVSQREAPVARKTGNLEILPTGSVAFECHTDFEQTDERAGAYQLTLNNGSNVAQQIALSLNRVDIPWHEKLRAKVQRRLPQPAVTTQHLLQLSPADVDLKVGDRTHLALTTQSKPPLLGWRRRQKFQLRVQQHQTAVVPSTQTIELFAAPKVPLWLQCLGVGVVGLGLFFLFHWRDGHRGPVNSVQFDGQANTVISAADDQTVHRWQVSRGLRDVATFSSMEKSVRVVHYRPRQNNLLAAGLENGEIQIWDVRSARSPISLVSDRADRVFDLQFSDDSDTLFSIHGSGQVLRWNLEDFPRLGQTDAVDEKAFGFAAQAMALVGERRNLLAVGGRFNRLVLWDFEQNLQQSLAYPGAASPDHYLFDVAAAEDKPTRFAAADNQGRITLWNLDACSAGEESCRPSDQWTDGHGGESVNAVALSQDACYLVSGGDDGRVMLWSLNAAGQVMSQETLGRYGQPINSVDIVQRDNRLLVVSGGDDHEVRLRRVRANSEVCL